MALAAGLLNGYDDKFFEAVSDANPFVARLLSARFMNTTVLKAQPFFSKVAEHLPTRLLLLPVLLVMSCFAAVLVLALLRVLKYWRQRQESAVPAVTSGSSTGGVSREEENRRLEQCSDLLKSHLLPHYLDPLKRKNASLKAELQRTRDELNVKSGNLQDARADIEQKQKIIDSLQEALEGKNGIIKSINDLMNQYGSEAVESFLRSLGS